MVKRNAEQSKPPFTRSRKERARRKNNQITFKVKSLAHFLLQTLGCFISSSWITSLSTSSFLEWWWLYIWDIICHCLYQPVWHRAYVLDWNSNEIESELEMRDMKRPFETFQTQLSNSFKQDWKTFKKCTAKKERNNSTWGTRVLKSNLFVELKISKRHFEINWPLW